MPSTVADIFEAAGLAAQGTCRWGTPAPVTGSGNYAVSLTADPHSLDPARKTAPLDGERLARLLDVRPELRLDGHRPTVDELTQRLAGFWLSDEVVLYVGLAGTSVSRRVRDYYKTPLGARRPHAGGWWLKTLSLLDELWVHYAATPDDAPAEVAMLQRFADCVSPASRHALPNSSNPAPFANLRTGRGDNKTHGITGATGDLDGRQRAALSVAPQLKPAVPRHLRAESPAPSVGGGRARSQNVTAKDLEAARVRFPRSAKRIFPADRAYVDADLRGRRFDAVRWDPRVGPDQERSGLLTFGKGKLDGLVAVGDVLTVAATEGGVSLR